MDEPVFWTRRTMYEVISDTKGLLQNWQNDVSHSKYWELEALQPPTNLFNANCQIALSQAQLPNVESMLASVIPVPSSDVVGELARASTRHFVNAVDPRVLLLNFILELMTACKGGIGLVDKLGGILKKIKARYARELKRLLLKGILEADAHFLAWSFAIKPFMRDVEAIICSIEAAERRVKWLTKNAGKPVRVHYQRVIADFDPIDYQVEGGVPGHYYGPWNPSCPPWVGGCASPERGETNGNYLLSADKLEWLYSAQATVIYTLPPCRFIDGSGIGLVWASMMGLDRWGSAIWEAIPFSFVIDWFTDVGKQAASWLDDKTKNFPDGQILEVGHSFKLSSEWTLTYVDNDSECPRNEILGRVGYKSYTRKRGLPEGSSYHFDLGGLLDPYRSTLSIALVTTRWKALLKRKSALIKALSK